MEFNHFREVSPSLPQPGAVATFASLRGTPGTIAAAIDLNQRTLNHGHQT